MAVGDWFSVFMRFLLIHGKWMAGPSAPALAPLLWVPPLPLKNYSPLYDGDKSKNPELGVGHGDWWSHRPCFHLGFFSLDFTANLSGCCLHIVPRKCW